jgi:hypothetical protein
MYLKIDDDQIINLDNVGEFIFVENEQNKAPYLRILFAGENFEERVVMTNEIWNKTRSAILKKTGCVCMGEGV